MRMCILNRVLLSKHNIFYLCIFFKTFCVISMYLSVVKHLPEDGHMSGRNM